MLDEIDTVQDVYGFDVHVCFDLISELPAVRVAGGFAELDDEQAERFTSAWNTARQRRSQAKAAAIDLPF